MVNDPLSQAVVTYEANKETLVAESEGKWVVIRDAHILGVWDTYEDALKSGYAAAGLAPFLVKKIEGIEQLHFITRDVETCPS